MLENLDDELKIYVKEKFEISFMPIYFLEIFCLILTGYLFGMRDYISSSLFFVLGLGFSFIAGWLIKLKYKRIKC